VNLKKEIIARLDLAVDRLGNVSTALFTLGKALIDGPYLVGVTIRPVMPAGFEPGQFFAGGKSALLRRGHEAMLKFVIQIPFESFEVEVWGPCVMTDVRIGNRSYTFHSGEVGMTRGRFGAVEIGQVISVFIKVPEPDRDAIRP